MASKTGTIGTSGVAGIIALTGLWLVYAGVRDVPVFEGLRQVLRQERPIGALKVSNRPERPGTVITPGGKPLKGVAPGDSGIDRLVGTAAAAYPVLKARFPHIRMNGWRAQGSVPGSDHPRGLAIDVMTANRLEHVQVIAAFRALPGAKYWISFGKTASSARGWTERQYRGPSPHTDHVHLSFT